MIWGTPFQGSLNESHFWISHSLAEYLPLSLNGSIMITLCSHKFTERLVRCGEDVVNMGSMKVEVTKALLIKKFKRTE